MRRVYHVKLHSQEPCACDRVEPPRGMENTAVISAAMNTTRHVGSILREVVAG